MGAGSCAKQRALAIDYVAQDGIGVTVKARVTVRSHLDRFVLGATEETRFFERQLRLAGFEKEYQCRSYASTRATPVVLSTPRTIAV
jgi:hypothetical protein